MTDKQATKMERVEKTVFISYRRTNLPWALAIFQNLTHHGFDVFFDYSGLNEGEFETVILENVRARAHFLVLLTPSALEQTNDPGDWLRREIETALENRRNIVPLFLEGFDYSSPKIAGQLTGSLEPLKFYNGLVIPADYFLEAMSRLRDRYLNAPLSLSLHPVFGDARKIAAEQRIAAEASSPVQQEELTAQQWFERGRAANDPDEKIRLYTNAIRLKPDYVAALINRGASRSDKGDLDGAFRDFNEAIRLKPDQANAYNNRGLALRRRGDLDSALRDYSEAIRIKPDYGLAFYNRGLAKQRKGDVQGAKVDLAEATRLGFKPKLRTGGESEKYC